jgi:lysophospholipid acyltransferase (LPLAT)-like uncharacterized protein
LSSPSASCTERVRSPPAQGTRRHAWIERLLPPAAWLVAGVLLLLKLTTRRRVVHGAALFESWARAEPMILAFWHEQLVMMPFPYRGKRVCIMVSQHRDGELISRALRPLRIGTVRGSSTRGWAGALKGLLRAFHGGADLAFAPDGPRGPRYLAKSGVIQVARATGAAIVPVAAAAGWCRRVKSWDRLIIPFPWSRIVYVVGERLAVPANAGPEAVEQARVALERELARLTAEAGAAVAA